MDAAVNETKQKVAKILRRECEGLKRSFVAMRIRLAKVFCRFGKCSVRILLFFSRLPVNLELVSIQAKDVPYS